MPTEEQKRFFEKHLDELEPLIENENKKRISAGEETLSEEEIDSAVNDWIDMYKRGMPFKFYSWFKAQKPVEHAQVRRPQPQVAPVKKKADFTFEITKCSNGYLISVNGELSIFRDMGELGGVLGPILFPTQCVPTYQAEPGCFPEGELQILASFERANSVASPLAPTHPYYLSQDELMKEAVNLSQAALLSKTNASGKNNQ